ncbi:hypothetical protein F443_14766 [Phytophthora nicotianae P1569]|uniref:Uncharacterized protein n=1 Tax=Phytophthora nicotianae P1569 TaxID=1317065 RepID=V9ENK0_PHYNI|nr:hypothetical protein F443_14766 [Phytophthora nicotianae P1569]
MVDDAGQAQGAVANNPMASASVTDRGGAVGNSQVAAPVSNRREAAGHGRIQPAIGRRQGAVGQTQANAAADSHHQDAVQIGATNGRSSISRARVTTSTSRSTYSRTDEVDTYSSSSERTDEEMG